MEEAWPDMFADVTQYKCKKSAFFGGSQIVF